MRKLRRQNCAAGKKMEPKGKTKIPGQRWGRQMERGEKPMKTGLKRQELPQGVEFLKENKNSREIIRRKVQSVYPVSKTPPQKIHIAYK